jgi:hypothetical protein
MIILKQVLNIEDLPEDLQQEIIDEINEPIRAGIGFTIQDAEELLNEYEVEIPADRIFQYVNNGQYNRMTRNEFYHPTNSPVISRLGLGNYPRGNSNTRSDYIADINRSEIRPTAALLQEQVLVDTIRQLEIYLQNEPSRGEGHEPPFSEQDIQNMERILNVLQDLDIEREETDIEINIEKLTKLFGDIAGIEILEGKVREQFYQYWKETNVKYEQLVKAFASMEDAWMTNQITVDLLAGKEVIIGIQQEIPKDIKDQIKEITETLKDKEIIIPNYIVQMPVIASRANEDEDKVKYLIVSYLEYLTEERIPKRLRPYSKRIETDVRLDPERRDEGGRQELPQERAAIPDPGTFETEEEMNIQVEEDRLEQLTKIDEVDPYFAILLARNPKLIKVDEGLIQRAVDEIVNLYEYEESDIGQEIRETHLQQITRFMDLYKTAANIANNPPFYLHITDDPVNVKAIKNAFLSAKQKTIGVQYAKAGEDKWSVKPSEYEDAIKFINTETIKLMEVLTEMIEVTNNTTQLPLKRAKGGTREAAGAVAFTTPTYVERQSKLGEINKKLIKTIPLVMTALREYYFIPLSSKYVILDDLPEFALSTNYRKAKVILDKSFNNLLVQSLVQDEIVVIQANDVKKITAFFKELRKGTELEYSNALKDKASSALEALLKLYGGLSKHEDKEGNSLLRILIDNYESLFGAILYDIAEADLRPENLIDEKWEGHKLSYYVTRYDESQFEIENIYSLLIDPTYESFIAKADSETNHIRSEVKRLKYELTRSEIKDLAHELAKSMLEAYDTIREINNKQIYKASLDIDDYDDIDFLIRKIRKDNKINILINEIESVLCQQESYEKIAKCVGFSEEIVYKIKGMFR